MILIVVPTKNGPELVNFENVTYTESTENNVTLYFGGQHNSLKIGMTKEELIHEVLSAINRDSMPLHNHKSILVKKLKEDSNENNY